MLSKVTTCAIRVATLLCRSGRQRAVVCSEAISSAARGAGCETAEATENPCMVCKSMVLQLLLSVSVYFEQQIARVETGCSMVLWQAECGGDGLFDGLMAGNVWRRVVRWSYGR